MDLELVEVDNLVGHDQTVWHASFSPSKLLPLLATCGADKTVRIWKYQSSAEASEDSNSINNSSGDADAKILDESHKMKWIQVAVLEEVQNRTIRSCEFSPNGRYIACASFDATIAIWELNSIDELSKWNVVAMLEGHENEVKSVSWSPSGSLLASCSRDKSVWIWDTSSTTGEGNILGGDDDEDNENAMSSSSSNGNIGGGNKNKSGSFECVSVLPGHSQDVKYVQWHPHEDILLSCGYDDTIRIWMEGVNDWFTASNLTGHANTVWNASFNSVGDKFATCSQDCSVIIWAQNKEYNQDAALASVKGTPQWEAIQVLENVHSRTIYSLDWSKLSVSEQGSKVKGSELFSANELIVTGGGDNAITVLAASKSSNNTSKEEEEEEVGQVFQVLLQKQNAHDTDVNCVRWHPYILNIIVSTSDDGSVKLWMISERSSAMDIDVNTSKEKQ